jgi:spore coat protein H
MDSYGQAPGNSIFNYEGIHDIRLTFIQPDFWDSLLIYKEEGDQTGIYTYMSATVDFDGQIIDSTGVRLKGNSSYWAPGKKKSIKLKFNEYVSGQKLDGLKKVNLNNNFNDPTLMREKLFLDVLQKSNVYAPRCVYARVYINDVYWGLYTLVDHVDKVFLLLNFNDKSGNLYKGDKDPAMPCANLAYHTDPIEYRDCYTLETNEDVNDWSDLENLIDIINHTPLPEYHMGLSSVLNATSFINAWATNIVFVNVDSYVETGHNYYTYHNPISNKFEWITWDVNEAFGLWNVGMPLEQLYNLDLFYLPPEAEFFRPLSYFMLQVPVFRKMYTDKVYELVCTEFNPEILFPKIEGLYSLIRDDVYSDSNKIISTQNFETNIHEDILIPDYPGWVPGLKSFIQQRHDILISRLSELGYSFPCIINSIYSERYDDISIYPNPTNYCINLDAKYSIDKTILIEILNTNGQILESKELNENIENIDISSYAKGIYFIKFIFENSTKTEKIIKF